MRVGDVFSGAARDFLDELKHTRRSLVDTALRLKLDARHARSWGFFAIGWTAGKMLDRAQDKVEARESNLRAYAKRAVECTYAMRDPQQRSAFKQAMLLDNIDGITSEEMDRYIAEQSDTIAFPGYTDQQRGVMLANAQRQIEVAEPSCAPSNPEYF